MGREREELLGEGGVGKARFISNRVAHATMQRWADWVVRFPSRQRAIDQHRSDSDEARETLMVEKTAPRCIGGHPKEAKAPRWRSPELPTPPVVHWMWDGPAQWARGDDTGLEASHCSGCSHLICRLLSVVDLVVRSVVWLSPLAPSHWPVHPLSWTLPDRGGSRPGEKKNAFVSESSFFGPFIASRLSVC